jgi:GntR family transcriptional regulator, rspAB operon transcriptional repressor
LYDLDEGRQGERVVPLTDTQRAYELIRKKIITTEMAPGSVIREASLMEETRLGRTPIREALKMLEAERLVTVSPRRGMFVTTINISDLSHIQEVRSALDPLSVRLAAVRITPAELTTMRALVDEIQATVQSGDMARLMALDWRFHCLLSESTRNPILISQNEMLYNLSLRIWHFYLDRLTPDDLAFDKLAEIVAALAARDPVKAERALAAHIADFGLAIRKWL